MERRRGRDALLEVLRSESVTHLFGNPGTTELPLIDALAEAPDLRYVLAAQEATAVGMADGYAQATKRPALLNLHTSAGLGNAIGNLTNARANATPLVVTAGQQDRRHLFHDPLLSGDLVALARPVSKWAHEVRHLGELGAIMRRAFLDAATPPTGPVFVSLPMDILDEVGEAPVPARTDRHLAATAAGLDELADRLCAVAPERLLVVAGDEVAASGAVPALVALAEALGAGVQGSPLHSNVVFPTAHGLFAGSLPPNADALNKVLSGYDTVFLVGAQAFMVYPWSPGPAVPESVELLHLSPDPAQLGRTWPAALALAGDPRASLEGLVPLVQQRVDGARAAAALSRAVQGSERQRQQFEEKALQAYDGVPIPPAAAAHSLLRAMPPGTRVVDEAITTGSHVRGFHRVSDADRYYFCRGGGLGWGMPAALGVSLGTDREPVLCVVGDGSALYSPQALWTAAREDLPVVFAVVDNRQYRILKDALRSRDDAAARTDNFVGMELDAPAVDFVGLSRSFGVDATLVEKAADVADAVHAALQSGHPHLLHLPIAAP